MQVTAGSVPRKVPLAAAMFDMSRGRQALLSIAQPVLCVLIALGGLPSLRVALLGMVAAVSGELAVYSLNDVLDARVDAESLQVGKTHVEGFDIDIAFVRHPIAHGNVSLSLGIGWVEGWRGEVLIALETGAANHIRRFHPHDPSWQNWPLLERAVLGNIVPDFPLINKSFNLSYSGHDL